MKLLYALILFLCLPACSPIYVVQVQPTDPDEASHMLYGNAVMRQSVGSAIVDLSYYDATENYLVFNLEVRNDGEEAFDFDPAEINLVTDNGGQVPAINPEIQLFTMDLENAKQRRNARTTAWVGGGLLVVSTVASVISGSGPIETGSAEATAAVVSDVAFNASDLLFFAASDNNYRSRTYYDLPREELPLPDSRFFWLDHALRVTTVHPGETVGGKLAFPRLDQARELTVVVPLPEGQASFAYDQMAYRP